MRLRELYNHLPLRVKVLIFKYFLINKKAGYGEPFSYTLNAAFDTFLTPNERGDKRRIKNLTNDIVKCWLQFKALPYEYFLFDFKNRNDSEREEFETDIDRIETLRRVTGVDLFLKEINDKYNFYLLAKPFFHRQAIKVEGVSDLEAFLIFCQKYNNVFIKPLGSTKGRGARLFSYSDDEQAKLFFTGLFADGESWMVEERIKQSLSMGQWNVTSVNTIRIPSILREGKFTVIWTRMRMGKKGSIVDNAGAGGIVVNVDPASGVITSDGIDESFNHFEKHPDSGLVFKGWQVPRWQELLATVEQLHRDVFGRHVYVAWDFALTDEGWVVIEGNWGQLLGQQTASQVGVRRQFHELVEG